MKNSLQIIAVYSPGLARVIAPFMMKHWKDKRLVFWAFGLGLCEFDYADNTTEELPILQQPIYKRIESFHWNLIEFHNNPTGEKLSGDLESLVKSADEIIYASNPHSTDMSAFINSIRSIFKDVKQAPITSAFLAESLDEEGLEKAWDTMKPFEEVSQTFLRYGQTVDYFTFNYQQNSMIFFKRWFTDVGLNISPSVLSAYEFQAFYYLSANEGLTEDQLITEFENWKGSKTYAVGSLGSPVTYSSILENLVTYGLVEVKGQCYISPAGKKFLQEIADRFKDQDLPMRLHLWSEKGMKNSKSEIDHYLILLFGGSY